MRGSPTEIERRILDFMVAYLRENTYQPSIREIGERFGIKSTKTVSEHLQALANKGFLERDPSRSRGVRILGMDLRSQGVAVPCYSELPGSNGRVAESTDLHLTLDRRLVGGEDAFCVRLSPDEVGALGAGAGDLAVLVPAELEDIPEGGLVAARIPGPGRFFRVSRNGRGLTLAPLGGGDAMYVEDAGSIRVAGRVIGLFGGVQEQIGTFGTAAH